MTEILSDLCTHILVEYDDNPSTTELKVLKVEEVPHPDAFLGILDALRSILAPGMFQNRNVSWLVKEFSLKLSNELKRTPTAIDLPLIRFMKKFYEFFDEPSEYMHHARDIVHVEANKSLYKIRFVQPTILFSYKLGIYQRLLESAVNSSMNEVFALIENKKAEGEDFRKWADKAETSILNIVNDINIFFNQYDDKVQNWKKVVSDSLTPSDCAEFYEMIVFYHLLAAQMCRYWLELNRRMGYCNNELRLEAHRFYKQFLHISPDTGIIDIVPTDKHDESAAEHKKKTEKKPATPKKEEEKMRRISFRINEEDEENRKDTISALFEILCDEHHIIPAEDKRAFTCLLSGGTSSNPIHCPREYKTLLGLFFQDMHAIIIKNRKLVPIMVGERGKIDKEEMQRFVTVSKEGASFWEVVYEWFVDKDGNYYEPKEDKLKDATFAKKWADILDELHRALLGIDKKQALPKFR